MADLPPAAVEALAELRKIGPQRARKLDESAALYARMVELFKVARAAGVPYAEIAAACGAGTTAGTVSAALTKYKGDALPTRLPDGRERSA